MLDTALLVETIRANRVDAVMHFAASLSVGESVRNPAGYYRNNVIGTLSVLEAMIAGGAKYLVFSSTAAVFGNPLTTPITEDHPEAADQRLRRDQAGRRTGAAALRARLRHPVDGAAVLQRGGGRSRRRARRAPRPRISRHPQGHRRGARRAARSSSLARTTTRPTAPACATTSTSPIWRPRISPPSGAARRRGDHRLQPRQRPADVGSRDPRIGRARDRTPGAVHGRCAAGRRSGGPVRRRASASAASSAGRRSTKISTRSWKPPGAGVSATLTATQPR